MNIKKKLFAAGLALSFCVATASFAIAGDFTNTNGGDALVVNDGTSDLLSVSVSPGVVVRAEIVDNAFALATTNANANANNRIEYGIWSAFSGYYQQPNPDATDPFTAANMIYNYDGDPATTASPFAGGSWTAIGDTGS